MSEAISFDEAIQAIHQTLEQAENQLSRLGERLQFLIGPQGEVAIARRGKTGDTLRPKVVIAELAGCDPMLWRPDHPRWMRSLDPARDAEAAEQAASAADAEPASEPPTDAPAGEETGADPAAREEP